MGTCFTSCLPQSKTSRVLRNFSILDNNTDVDFRFLVEDNVCTTESSKTGFLSRLFTKRANKKLVDGLLNPQMSTYTRLSESEFLSSIGSYTSKDIQLQCLDARALLQRTTNSTPVSSLDLEWEHETLPLSMVHDPSGSSWTAVPDDFSRCPSISSQPNTTPATTIDADWSRVSSANSLEWDNVQNAFQESPQPSEVDTDTQFLLREIERLTNKTLEETGQDLFS